MVQMGVSFIVVVVMTCWHVIGSLSAVITLPDTKANVGKIFKYRITPEENDGTELEVTEANQDSLPSWLYYSSTSRTLKGVPGPADRGVYILAVKGLQQHSPSAVDVFAVSVLDDDTVEVATPRSDDNSVAFTCRPRDPVTAAIVVVDTDMAALTARERVRLLTRLASAVGVHEMQVDARSTVGGGWLPSASDKSTLVAGPGDVPSPKLTSASTVASWIVGCGTVSSRHVDLLEELEKSAQDGQLSLAVGHGIVGWRVTNRLPADDGSAAQGRPSRLKRQAQVTPTAVPYQPGPTSVITGDLSRTAPPMASATDLLVEVMATATIPHRPSVSTLTIRPTAVFGATTSALPPPVEIITAPAPTAAPTTVPAATTAAISTAAVAVSTTTVASTTVAKMASTAGITIISSTLAVTEPTTHVTTPATTTADAKTSMSAVSSAMLTRSKTARTQTQPPTTTLSPASTTVTAPRTSTSPLKTQVATTVKALPPVLIDTSVPKLSTTAAKPSTTPTNVQRIVPKPLRPVIVQPGQLLVYLVPYDTFVDEDGMDMDLQVALMLPNGSSLPSNYWLTFDPLSAKVTLLASERETGEHQFVLGARDPNPNGGTAQTMFVVRVVAPPPGEDPVQLATQTYRLTIDADYDELMRDPAAKRRLAEALRLMHGGKTVYITSLERGSVVVSYVLIPNEGLMTEPDECDAQAARLDNMKLFNEDGTLKSTAQSALPFRIISFVAEPRGPCEGILSAVGGAPLTVAVVTTTTTRRVPNRPPVASVQSINVGMELGKELRYEIPDDLFQDEDGNTRLLKLKLQVVDSSGYATELTSTSLLRLDPASTSKKALLYGLTLEKPNMAATEQWYQLQSTDQHGLSTAVRIIIAMTPASARSTSGEAFFLLRVTLGIDYSAFINNVDRQIELVRLLARVYGDSSTIHVALRGVKHGPSAKTTLVSWTNTSVVSKMSPANCPQDHIRKLSEPVLRDGKVASSFPGKMKPFIVSAVELLPFGPCVNVIKPVTAAAPLDREAEMDREAEADGFWLTVVLPVVIIITLLVMAIVVAAVLISRRRRNARMNVSGNGNGTFIGKGVPVIFDEEREDGGGTACRAPLVQSEDKPVPPPEYPRYGSDGREDSAYLEQKQPLMQGDAHGNGAGGDSTPPYQPPTPPVSEPDESSTFSRTGNSGSSAYARGQQQTFVPP